MEENRTRYTMMKTALLCLAWIVLCVSFFVLFVGIDLDLNFFSWVGNWRSQSLACMTGIIILLVATYFLALGSQKKLIAIVAVVSCIVLIGAALSMVVPEKVVNPGWWLSRTTASPGWYRWGRLAIACIPLCILIGARSSLRDAKTG